MADRIVHTISSYGGGVDRRAPARIAYKAAVDATAKAVMLVVTIVAARRLPRDAFGVLALAMTTGWLLGVASAAATTVTELVVTAGCLWVLTDTRRMREATGAAARGLS
jgi:hypothetical protein